jgi:hypothetical protein
MAAILRAKDLTPDELAGLLAALRFPESAKVRAWLEGPDGWSLAYWPGTGGSVLWYGAGRLATEQAVQDLLPRLVGGRIFAPAGELRWRTLPALGARTCRTVYLGQDLDTVASLEVRYELAGLQARSAEHPLWGLLTAATRGQGGEPDAWVELRVPHRFRYPVEPIPAAERVAVKAVVETWIDVRGDAHFVRLCDLQAYPGE